ncbi:MAG: hypothetical protein AB7L09_21385 [Nitrospira sp.]
MAKLVEVAVRKEVIVNTGNYENVKVAFEEKYAVEDGDDVDKVRANAVKSVNAALVDEVDAIENKVVRARSRAGRFGIM